MMKSIITKEMLKDEGFVFKNEDDELLFIEFVQKELEQIVGEKIVEKVSRQEAVQLAEYAYAGDENRIGMYLKEFVPEYEDIVIGALRKIKNDLIENRCNNEVLRALLDIEHI